MSLLFLSKHIELHEEYIYVYIYIWNNKGKITKSTTVGSLILHYLTTSVKNDSPETTAGHSTCRLKGGPWRTMQQTSF